MLWNGVENVGFVLISDPAHQAIGSAVGRGGAAGRSFVEQAGADRKPGVWAAAAGGVGGLFVCRQFRGQGRVRDGHGAYLIYFK